MTEIAHDITPQIMAAWQARQVELEQERMQNCINELIALARDLGYELAAMPKVLPDGRLGADWGVRKAT